VVGIAVASASVGTLVQLLGDRPARAGLCFVVLAQRDTRVHLPARLSQLPHLTVEVVADSVALRANHVYIVTAGQSANLRDGTLHCTRAAAHGLSSTDSFLRSLAEDCGARAIGVVLAGCGTQGQLGCGEIRMAGGMTLAQRPDEDQAGSRLEPQTDPGAFDLAVAAHEMAPPLLRYATTTARLPARRSKLRDDLRSALPVELRADFTAYDPALLVRRVAHRMRLLGVDQWREYCQRLGVDPQEVQALRQDLERRSRRLVADAEHLSVMASHLVPAFLARVGKSRPLRVWIPGCGSGEEAYAVAMLLHEEFAAHGQTPRLMVFATCADAQTIAVARRGIFPHTIAADLSRARLQRYFVRSGEGAFRVRDALRASLVFSVHKLFVDPPFSQMDLVVGGNLLASLAVDARAKALEMFHFALCASGCLLLGDRDRPRGVGEKFQRVKGQGGLWRRVAGATHDLARTTPALAAPATHSVQLHDALSSADVPAAVLIDEHYAVLSSAGPLLDYLQALPSEAREDLRALLRPGLRSRVLRLCQAALRDGRPLVAKRGHVVEPHGTSRCLLTVRPLASVEGARQLVVVFERPSALASAPPAAPDDDAAPRPRLRDALRSARQAPRATRAELQQSRDACRTSTEEMLSVNEELRSTNEELQNTEDELRAANQALNRSNQGLAANIAQLEHMNDDINNLIASTEIATLMLDMELRIRRYTPPIQRVLPILPDDIGRPLSDFAAHFDIAELTAECRQVIESQTERSREFELQDSTARSARAGAWFVYRILPYRTRSQRQVGVLVTFIDISERKQRELALARSHQDLGNLLTVLDESVSTIGDAVVVSDLQGNYLRFNDAAQKLFDVAPEDLPPHKWAERLEFFQSDMLTRVAPEDLPLARALAGKFLAPTEFFVRTPSRSQGCWCVAMAAPVHDGNGNYAAVAVLRDTTEKKRAEQHLRASEGRLRAMLDTMQDAVFTSDVHGTITSANRAAAQTFGYSQFELPGSHFSRLLASTSTSARDADLANHLDAVGTGTAAAPRKFMARHKSGTEFPINISVSVSPSIDMYTAVIRDMSAEQALQRLVIEAAEAEQRRIGQVLHDHVQQQLSSLGFIADALRETLPADAPDAMDLARRMEAGLSSAIGDIQRLARGLVPAEIETIGLRDALMHLVSKTAEESRLTCHLDYDDTLEVGNQTIANQLFRIVAESVSNAVKHSGARSINIAFHVQGGELVLTVEDDGIGIEQDTDFAGSAGVRIMRYRAEALGGQLTLGRSAQGGALITFTGPYR